MFPTINVTTTRLETCQRVLLLEYNAETDRILLRQYSIAVKAAGVAKNLKKLLDRRGDAAALHESLGKLTDISELMTKSGYGSESEGEDAEAGRVELADRGTRQSRIKLTEIGPRMELEVIKIEEGLCEGKVLYHRYEARTEEEVREKDDEMEAARRLKSERKRVQDENVRRKQALQKAKDDAKKDKKERRKKAWWEKEEGEREEEKEKGGGRRRRSGRGAGEGGYRVL
jgi:ribosome biogenesis protein SSF1/2